MKDSVNSCPCVCNVTDPGACKYDEGNDIRSNSSEKDHTLLHCYNVPCGSQSALLTQCTVRITVWSIAITYRADLVLLFRGKEFRELRTCAVVPDEERILRVTVQQFQYLQSTSDTIQCLFDLR